MDGEPSAEHLLGETHPVPEAVAWIDHSVKKMFPYQKPDGFIERWYGDGNWSRTLLLYALMKTQGCYPRNWQPGVEVGAVRDGRTLYLSVHSAKVWHGEVVLDHARHHRILNLKKNYARLNQWPEWYTVDENTLYTVRDPATNRDEVRLGSELKAGFPVALAAGATRRLVISPLR